MGVAEYKGPLRLRRVGVEHGIDAVGVGSLQSRVLLKAVPDAVVRTDGVVYLDHYQIFAIAVIQRLCPYIGAAGSIEQTGWSFAGSKTPLASSGQVRTGVGVPAVSL